MLLSIIIPVYNVEKYVLRCLQSISAQTISDFEVIIVDDGSTDSSGAIAEEFCRAREHFNILHKKNGGLVSAWLFGLKYAKGEYIGFVDSDDYIDSSMYETLLKYAIKYDSEIVLCNHYYIKETNCGSVSQLHINEIESGFYEGPTLKELHSQMIPLLGKNYISPARWNKIIKRDLLLSNIKYCDVRVSSGEDVNIMLPCLLSCKRFYYVDEPLYYYEYRASSISNIFKQELLESYLILISKLEQFFSDKGFEYILDVYNFYGVLWCLYVDKSKLNVREKCGNIKKLFAYNDFFEAKYKITFANGFTAMIYKLMLTIKSPILFIIFNKIKNKIRK